MSRAGTLAIALVALLHGAAATAQEHAPRLDHLPVLQAARGEALQLRAHISSPVGRMIIEASAFVRFAGVHRFARIPLIPEPSVNDLYVATLKAGLVTGDFDYYLEAFDADGNGPGRFASPESPQPVAVVAPEVPRQALGTVQPAVLFAPPPARSHGLTITFASIGGSAVGIASVFGVLFNLQREQVARAAEAGVTLDAGSYGDGATMATVTNVFLGIGAVALAGALTSALWPEPKAGPRPQPVLAPANAAPPAAGTPPAAPKRSQPEPDEFER